MVKNGHTIDMLQTEGLEARISTLESAVDKLAVVMERAPGIMSMTADIVDEGYQKVTENGIDVQHRLGKALEILEKLTSDEMLTKLNQLMEFSDRLPGMIAMFGDMFDEEYKKLAKSSYEPVGPLGLYKAMKDPDMKRAMGFLTHMGKSLGKRLE